MNEAILSLGVIKEPGNPILSAWISSDSHYAFVEFRNSEEANLGFKLLGMNINGSEIKLGRPKSYENTMQ
jgi:splicing factor U2AF 65 kDa subunit